MSELVIRHFMEADRPALLGLVRELQVAESQVYDRMKPPEAIGNWYLDGLLEACRRQAGQILIAEQAGRVLGYAVIQTACTSEDQVDEVDYSYAYVQDIAVSEPARGQGIGRALLARCEELARAAEARWLRITVLADNAPAVRAYQKAGFKPLTVDLEKPLG